MKKNFFKKALSVFTAIAMMLSLMTGIPFGELGLGITANAASASTPVSDGNRVYANGTPITIEAGSSSSTASVWYMNGSTKTYVAENVSGAVIYGGCDGESLDSDTKITMTGGSVDAIYGGGYNTDCSKGYVNNVNINISGGTVSYGVYASKSNWVKGNVNITVTGGNISTVYGCTLASQVGAGDNQEYCKVSGNTSVTITGGTVGTLKIGDGYSPVNGTKTGIVTIPGVTLETNSGFNAENEYDNLYINDGTTFVIKGDVTLPENTKFVIPSGNTFTLNGSTTIEAPYGIENNGTLNIEPGCTDTYNIENNGTLNISTLYTNSEGIVNNGTINLTKPILGGKPTGNGTINRNTAYISGISSVSSISVKMDDADYALANGYYETADGKLYLWLPSGYAVVFVDGSVYCGTANEGTAVELIAYKAVADIETIPSRISVGIIYNLAGYAVTNNDATYKTIEWSVLNANGTGATITDNVIKATSEGTATIRATVRNGQAYGEDYHKDYTIEFYETDEISVANGSITISKKDENTVTITGGGLAEAKEYPMDEYITIIGTTDSNTITISEGTTANVILSNVSISSSNTPIDIQSGATLNLTLLGENTLTSADKKTALHVPSGAKLVITDESTGSLNATGGHRSAGIGGNHEENSGDVEIHGGTITAKSPYQSDGGGAGIGGGWGGSNGSVTITGGYVNASSANGGAGIGAGYGWSRNGGKVTITGGTVIANGVGPSSRQGAGIGGGHNNGDGGNVVITGGNVQAIAGDGAEAIGKGNGSGSSGTLKDSAGNDISLIEITLDGVSDKTSVTNIVIDGSTYGSKDVVTIGDKLYLYLPADTIPTSVTAGGNTYICNADGTFYQEHNWVNATCFSPKHCTQCEITEGIALSHNYVNGVCTVCGMDENGVFHIKTAEQLVAFAQYVNAGNKDAKAVLDADIDMTGVAWTPICQTVSFHDTAATDTGYSGTFDGNGHTISNLTVTGIAGGTYSYGLFGTVSGTVKNLGMVNYTYTMGSATDARAGSIAGQVISGGSITNCYSVGHTVTTSNNIAGGIAGCNYGGTISNCYALNGSVSGYDTRWGGVVGDSKKDDSAPDQAQTYGTVSNCYTDDTRVVSSQNDNGSITSCAVKDDAAFASGEITYLLNGSSSGNVTWYQTLETDTYPVLDSEHGKVYSVFNCDESATVYRNVNENEPHTDNNSDGVCDVCGGNAHIHEWTYTASNNTITAECGAADCPATGTNTIVISASGKTYDGTAVTATVENNVDTNDYSSSIVYKNSEGDVVTEAVNAGTYTANLTVGGVTASVEFTIAKGTPDIGTVSASNLVNTLDVSEVVLSRSNETVPGTLSLADGTTLQYGTKDYTYVFTPNDNTNYETVTGTVSITITDTNAPTATYKVGTDGWKQFINTITFGHFCKDYTTVDITYSDEGSGVADKQYYISNEEITNTENIQWSEYTDTLNINATGKYYIYVRVTDNYGNVVIQNSEGIVVYEESVIAPTSLTFEYGDENDLYINISANGNTFANLADGSGNEIATENYSIDGSTLTIKGEYLSDLDVGEYTYKICMNPQGVENTEVTLAYSFVVKVTAKELTVTADNASKTYGEDDPTFTYTATDLEVNDTLTGTLSRETGENVGTYAITQGTLANPNYEITFVEGTFTINKATPPALTIPTATSITYGEKLSASTLSDGWAWVDGTIVPDAYTDCNAYIEVDDSNYDYTSVYGYDSANHRVVRDITVLINRATLTITANSYTIKVGSALPTYDYTVTGLVGDDTLPVDVTISCSATDSNAVGAYPITISGVVSDAPLASHYVINYVNGTLTISEKDIQEIKADDVTLTYGETKNIGATTNGDGAITYSTTSDVISIAADGTITALKAGTATVTINAAETDNYAAATKTVTVTVNKKKVAVPTADTTEYTYTGTAQTYGVTSTDDYTVEGGVQTNAGEYPITITLNNENYEWDGTLGTYKFVINKAAVTVTAKSYSIKVGEALPTYAYDVAGLVNGETLPIDVTISCNAADSNTAGTYTITVSGAANSTNYTFAYVNGTLTISNKLEQTITASDVTLTYGETGKKITATTNGNGAISYSTTSDVISVAADGTITAHKAGTATVTINVAETDTYAAATKTVTVTVNKAAVTVTAKSYTIKVGEALPTYAYDVAGLVNGETLPIDVTISCNVADSNTAGTYTITVSGAANSTNYTFSYVNGTLTVSEKEVVATPTFTPASGTTFTSSQKVTISCATAGAKIYYTTDGTEPTTASTLYNGAFTITTTTTIKAIAVKDGMTDSAVVTATYTKKSSGGGGGGGGYTPSRPSTPNNPEIGGKSASWATIASDISKLPIGSEITIELNGNYDVPLIVIKAIADREVKVTFVVDSTRNWYVDGAEIETPAAADLSILYIASLKVDGLRGDVGTKIRIDGTNIPTELVVALDKKHAGKFANLYKKKENELVFVDNIKVDENGKVILPVSEQGDYVIMLCEFSDRKGDVSNDGVTNALDASAILKDIVELEESANPVMLDYNGDGRVNALDASSILIDIVNDRI